MDLMHHEHGDSTVGELPWPQIVPWGLREVISLWFFFSQVDGTYVSLQPITLILVFLFPFFQCSFIEVFFAFTFLNLTAL
jgi:hypothetical protein